MGALPVKFSDNYNLNTFVHHRSLPWVSYARTFDKNMNYNFTVTVENRTSTSCRKSSFGKISIGENSLHLDAAFGSLAIQKEQIIELKFYRKLFPRLTVIGQKGDEYLHSSIIMFRQRKGRDIYNALESFGYIFTVDQEKIRWFDLCKELNVEVEKYGLYRER
jgi:hypothetical protein